VLDLLLVVPHPDDEAYGAGGTLAEYAATDRRTGLITLTRGGKGRNLGLCTPEDLPGVRDAELREAVTVLGISEFRQHDYPDGGLADVPRDEVIDLVASHLRALRPRVVITFPPDGSNRHPDHIATSEIATEAFWRAELPASGSSLYYYASPQPRDASFRDTWRPPTCSRTVKPQHLATKLKAIGCHRTQAVSTADFLKNLPDRIVTETFRRAVPEWTSSELATELE
jgi:LmbE family N-acetylglucosaminyl deacetylase